VAVEVQPGDTEPTLVIEISEDPVVEPVQAGEGKGFH